MSETPPDTGHYHRPDRRAAIDTGGPSLAGRRRLGAWVLVVALALVALLLFSRNALRLAEPGHRAFVHASIADCSTCHGAVGSNGLDWFHGALGVGDSGVRDDACLACHRLGDDAAMAHGVAPEVLAALTRQQANSNGSRPLLLTLARVTLGMPDMAQPAIACVACHREHHGAGFDLTAMADDTCQTCHRVQFDSLADGHPEFTDYPDDDITRLHFNHESHIDHYFRGPLAALAPQTCDACHSPDRSGSLMLVASFKETCESCHLDDIVGDQGRQPMVAFALPRADLAGLAAAGDPVGAWPAVADQPLAPFLRWLLAHDPAVAAALSHLPDDDLARADLADPEVAGDVATVLWSIKTLVRDVRDNGPVGIVALINSPGTGIRHEHMQRLVQDLRLDRIGEHADAWFPTLDRDLALHEAGRDAELPRGSPATVVADPDDLGRLMPDMPVTADWVRRQGVVWNDAGAVYWPVDHADTVLTFLLGLPDHHGESGQLIAALKSPSQAGSCIMCHIVTSADAMGTEAAMASGDDGTMAHGQSTAASPWQVQASTERLHGFTRFAHGPHLALALADGCLTCHKPRPHEAAAGSGRDFSALDRAVCLTCHQPDNAGDSCTTCHGYHAGHASAVVSDTLLDRIEGIDGEAAAP